MKKILNLNLNRKIIFVAVLTAANMSFAKADIQGFEFKVCSENKESCLVAKSPEAQASQIRPIYTFKNLNVEIIKADRISQEIKDVKGYLDVDSGQMVMIEKTKNGWNERVIRFRDMSQLTYNLK